MLGTGGVDLPQEPLCLPDHVGNSMAHRAGTAVKVFQRY